MNNLTHTLKGEVCDVYNEARYVGTIIDDEYMIFPMPDGRLKQVSVGDKVEVTVKIIKK